MDGNVGHEWIVAIHTYIHAGGWVPLILDAGRIDFSWHWPGSWRGYRTQPGFDLIFQLGAAYFVDFA